MKKEKIENWEQLVMRIEKITLDCHLNSISQEEARDEILELFKSGRENWLNLILERIKLNYDYDDTLGLERGYTQAMEDLEKLKEKIKKEV